MKRKIAAYLLSCIMVFSLTACTGLNINSGNVDKDSSAELAQIRNTVDAGENNQSESDPGDTKDNTETDKENSDRTEDVTEKVTVSGFPDYRIEDLYSKSQSVKDQAGEDIEIVRLNYREVIIDEGEEGDKYPFHKLAEKVNKFRKDTEEALDQDESDMRAAWDEMNPKPEENTYFATFYNSILDGVVRADSNVFSILRYRNDYWGGAHDGMAFSGINFDSATGEDIGFDDMFVNTNGLENVIADYLYANYDPDYFFAQNREELAADVKKVIDNRELVFTISYEGIVLYFNNYVLAPYVAGYQMVYLDASKNSKYLNQKYFENTPSEYMIRVNSGMYYPVKFSDGYRNMQFSWAKVYNEEFGFYSDTFQKFYAFSGDFKYEEEIELSGSFIDPEVFIVRKNGKDYIYVQNHFFDGVDHLQIFEPKDTLYPLAEYSGGPSYPNSNEIRELDYYENLSFGSELLFGETKAKINDSGTLDLIEVYNLEKSKEYGYSFSLTKDLDVFKADKDNMPSKDKATLKKGTVISVVCTDNKSFWTVEDDKGDRYSIEINVKDNEHYLKNGDLLYEYIEGHYEY
ncbi:MAG: RsiV family protein [Lachnospiraceae bacterium]|nr:RsiV family protein [Lachnospiraceae bacterium]